MLVVGSQILTLLVAPLLWFDVQSPVRVLLVVTFLLFVPGWAVVGLLRMTDPVVALVLSCTLSLMLAACAAQLLVWGGHYSVESTYAVLAAVSAIGTFAQLRTWLADRRSASAAVLGEAAS